MENTQAAEKQLLISIAGAIKSMVDVGADPGKQDEGEWMKTGRVMFLEQALFCF